MILGICYKRECVARHESTGSSSVSTASGQIAATAGQAVSPNNEYTYQTVPDYSTPPNQPGTQSHHMSTSSSTVSGHASSLNLSQALLPSSNINNFATHAGAKSSSTPSSGGPVVIVPGKAAISPPAELIMHTDNEDDEPLCSTCSTLDLCAILHDGIPRDHAVPLGHLTDILNKNDQCGLCCLIVALIRHSWQLDNHPGIDLGGITCTLHAEACGCDEDITSHRDICHHLYIKTSSRPRETSLALIAAGAFFAPDLEIRLLEEDASKVGRMKKFHGRRVGQNVDVGLLKNWISACENKHEEKCERVWWKGTGEVLPNSARIVDVVRMAIVPAPPTCRYVALSYIWGGPGDAYWTTQANLKQRSIPGGLDASMMPDTISDTIQLVRRLGEQYLWIDALCIVQDDPQDKAIQIGAMELIYSGSAFTIFAAGGTSVRDPLPGIRPCTRDPKQHVAKIQGLHLAVPLPVASEAIISSEWNKRGWTYQEIMLSRRRIYFTAHQVYFECRLAVCSEDIVAEPTSKVTVMYSLPTTGIGQVLRSSAPVNGRRDSYMELYIKVVGEYTQRRLTVESDIVDAVAALLNAMTKGVKLPDNDLDKEFKFGMSVGRNLEEALLWQPTSNARHSRRVPPDRMKVPWPSWSWAAWRGAVKYASPQVFVDMHSGRIGNNTSEIWQSLVEQWYIVDHDGHPVRQFVDWKERIINEDINLDPYIPYIAPKGDIDVQQLITENAPLLPGTLVFWTSYSRFDVTKADNVRGADAVADYAVYSIISDFPRPSTSVGRIILPRSTHSPTSFEFVVLARGLGTNGSYDEERLGRPYSGCLLYVMAVQKMQDERRMERVGVGVIFEQAWLNSTTEEKIIYLG